MRTLTKREVGQTPALLWASAEAGAQTGEAVYVLNKGKPAYRIEYIGDDLDPIEALCASGLATPPSDNPPDPPVLNGHQYTTDEVASILADIRGER
jgi:hypothetical protein